MHPTGLHTAVAPVGTRSGTLANRGLRGVRSGWPGPVLALVALACWPRAPLDAYEPVKLGLLALALALSLLVGATVSGRRATLVLAVAVLALLPGACTSVDPQTFWLGSPQRAQGGLALLLVLLAGALVPSSAAARGALSGAAVWTTLVLAVLALLQAGDLDPLQTGARRPGATFGSPLLLAQWLLLALPLCALAAWRAERPWPARSAVVLGLLALLCTQSRMAWLALLLVAVAALLCWRKAPRWRRVLLPGGALAVLLFAAWAWQQRPESLSHRVQLWEGAREALLAAPPTLGPQRQSDDWQHWRPLLGYGADLQVLPLRETAAASLRVHGADPDRAHQLLLDLLLRHGVLGVLLLLAGLWVLGRQLRPSSSCDDHERDWRRAVAVGVMAWLLSLQTAFALSADALFAALLLGALSVQRPPAAVQSPAGLGRRLGGLVLLAVAFVAWLLPAGSSGSGWRRPEQALLAFSLAQQRLRAALPAPDGCADVEQARAALAQAVALDPWRPEYPRALAEVRAALAARCAPSR